MVNSENQRAKEGAIIRRQSGAMEKPELGAQRIVSGMVKEALALAQAQEMSSIAFCDKAGAKGWNWEAFRHHLGMGVPKDMAKAAECYRKGAEKGAVFAQRYLGLFYLKGDGVDQDYVEAVKWLRLAGNQGDAKAQIALGDCYFYGQGVSPDVGEACGWYQKAAKQGDLQSQENARACLLILGGQIFEAEKPTQAYSFYKSASERSNEKGMQYLKALMNGMTAAEIAEGELRYREDKENPEVNQK